SGVLPASRSVSAWQESRCANISSLGSPNGILSASTANERRPRPERSRPTTARAPNWNKPRPLLASTRSRSQVKAGASNEAFGLDWPYPLFHYQKDGIERLLCNRSVLLADEMGLGKTIQAVAGLRILSARREI